MSGLRCFGCVDLSSELAAIVGPHRGRFGVYARNLDTDDVAEVNAAEVLPTESAAKTFVLLHYDLRVTSGDCDPSARVQIPNDFRFDGTGVIRHLSEGLTLTTEDLAWLMTVVSDNVATALLLLEIGGPEAVNETAAGLGLATPRLASFEEMWAGAPFGRSSARDLAEAYTHLDKRSKEKLFLQQDRIGLSRRLAHDPYAPDRGHTMPVRAYTKSGIGPTTFIDSGLFVTDTGRWVVAAMASELPPGTNRAGDPVPVAFGEISWLLWCRWNK
jgi:beta-lactamase class A